MTNAPARFVEIPEVNVSAATSRDSAGLGLIALGADLATGAHMTFSALLAMYRAAQLIRFISEDERELLGVALGRLKANDDPYRTPVRISDLIRSYSDLEAGHDGGREVRRLLDSLLGKGVVKVDGGSASMSSYVTLVR